MPPDGEGKDDDARVRGANQLHQPGARRLVVLEVGVRETGVQAHRDAQHLRRPLRLCGAEPRVPARSRLTLREVEDAHLVTGARGLGERAAARQLGVVAVGGYCQ